MDSKPRPSLLDLFDPLLADAVRVPIPDSPPMTPQKPRERSVGNKENLAPNEVTMSVFFNRISRSTHSPTNRAAGINFGPLVDLEDAEVWSGDGKAQVSPRVPLTELSVDNFVLTSPESLNDRPSNQGSMSPSRLSPPEKMPLPSSPPTAISMNDSFPLNGSPIPTTHFFIDSVFTRNIDPPKGSLQTSSSKGLLFSDQPSNPGRQPRRRSSIEISAALSSLSSTSFHMPDTSFDLVNGEISFLTKSSDEFDVDRDVHVDSWEPRTPCTSPQTLISEECPIDLSRTRGLPPDDILLTTTSTQPSIGHGEFSSESQLAHDQLPRRSGRTTIVEGERPTRALDTIRTEGQDTPPSARRVSSVPAPVKKLRVFTSKHHQLSYAAAKRGTAETLAASSSTSHLTSKHITRHNSGLGCGKSCDAGIPRGIAAKVIGDTVEQPKRKPTASSVKTNIKVPSRTVRSLEVSVLHKEEPIEPSLRLATVSRLPGPARARGGTVANQGRYGRPDSTQRGHSIPLRSKVRSGASSKDASRIPER